MSAEYPSHQKSRLTRVKPQQSEWLTTELFSAECGSPIKPCRVASANLILYPTIIPVFNIILSVKESFIYYNF